MSLKGSVKTMPLAELMLFLGRNGNTGTLELTRANAWHRIYFERGKIISSSSSDPRERLGHFLISENKITEEQLRQAMEVQEKTKVMLGKILVMIGAVSEEELLKMLESKFTESLFSMFLWDEADFSFLDDELPSVRLIPTYLEAGPVVEEGRKRCLEWKRLRQVYPSQDIRFKKNASTISSAMLSDLFVRNVYELIDDQHTIGDIVMQTHGTEPKVLFALEELKKKRLIAISGVASESYESIPSNIPDHKMLEMGKNKLAFGKYEEAINLFQYVIDHDEQSEDARALMVQAQEGLVRQIYDEVVSPTSVLQLKTPMDALAKEKLNSHETFIVARINGRWDVTAILRITPLPEVDALRVIKRLIDRNIVSLV